MEFTTRRNVICLQRTIHGADGVVPIVVGRAAAALGGVEQVESALAVDGGDQRLGHLAGRGVRVVRDITDNAPSQAVVRDGLAQLPAAPQPGGGVDVFRGRISRGIAENVVLPVHLDLLRIGPVFDERLRTQVVHHLKAAGVIKGARVLRIAHAHPVGMIPVVEPKPPLAILPHQRGSVEITDMLFRGGGALRRFAFYQQGLVRLRPLNPVFRDGAHDA